MAIHRWRQRVVRAEVQGTAAQRFFSLLLKNQKACWKIEEIQGGYRFEHLWKDRQQILQYAEKTGMQYEMRGGCGWLQVLQQCRKNTGLWIVPLTMVMVCIVLSQCIWRIEIQGTHLHTRYEILQRLEEFSIRKGMLKSQIFTESAAKMLLQKYEDLSYVSMSKTGSVLKVQIRERVEKPLIQYTEMETGSLIARDTFIVYSIITEQGTPRVKKGDIVQKGDILISGYTTVTADDGTVKYHPGMAKGKVLGVSIHQFRDHISKEGETKKYTKKVCNALAFIYEDRQIFLWKPFSNEGEYDIMNTNLLSFSLFQKQFQVLHQEYFAYEKESCVYSSDTMERMLTERLSESAQRWLIDGEKIEIERKWEFHESEEGMDGVLQIRIIEDITEETALESLESNEEETE